MLIRKSKSTNPIVRQSKASVLGQTRSLSDARSRKHPLQDKLDSPYEGPFGQMLDTAKEKGKFTERYVNEVKIAGLRSVSIDKSTFSHSGEPVEQPSYSLSNTQCNTVYLSQEYVDTCNHRIETMTKEIIDLLMVGESSYLLALESASTHVQAMLRDGFGVDASIDYDIFSVVSDIGKLSVVFHALKKSRLPVKHKSVFFDQFLARMAKLSCDTLAANGAKLRKKEEMDQRIRDLEVFVKNRNIKSSRLKKNENLVNPITGL